MEVLTSVDREKLAELRRRDHFFWLDLANPSPRDLDMLGELLGLHPLALEDTREWNQRPKLDRYENHVLLVFYSARTCAPEEERDLAPLEVHIYVSGSFIVTARREPCSELDALHGELMPEKTDIEEYLVYRILDGLTDAFYPVIDTIEGVASTRSSTRCSIARARAHLAVIYRLKQEVHDLLRRVDAGARPVPERRAPTSSPRCPDSRAARGSTCATSPTTSRRSSASSRARTRTCWRSRRPTSTPTPTA